MSKFLLVAPWPADDFEFVEAVITPTRSEGVVIINDEQPNPPNSTALAGPPQYLTERARIKAIADAHVPPPDPILAEIAWAKGVLTASDATWTGFTEAQFRLGMKRILRLYGRMIIQLTEGA